MLGVQGLVSGPGREELLSPPCAGARRCVSHGFRLRLWVPELQGFGFRVSRALKTGTVVA